MKYLKELRNNWSQSYDLEEKYLKLTTLVGMLSVLVGISLMLILFVVLDLRIAVDNIIGRIFVILLSILYFLCCLYLGVILVAGSLSLLWYARGQVSLHEAITYTFLSRYPKSWFISSREKTQNR